MSEWQNGRLTDEVIDRFLKSGGGRLSKAEFDFAALPKPDPGLGLSEEDLQRGQVTARPLTGIEEIEVINNIFRDTLTGGEES